VVSCKQDNQFVSKAMSGIESFAAPRDLLCSLFWGDLNGKSWEA
jgi:hypothetical protein